MKSPFSSTVNECHQECVLRGDNCDAFSVIDVDYKPNNREKQSKSEEKENGNNCFLYSKSPFTTIKGNGYLGASCYVMKGMKFEINILL